VLCIDLFCGLGGWSDGFLAEGWDVLGFDIERHEYGEQRYPGQLVLQDVLTIHGSQFKQADMIVASPPCQHYSYMAMPFSRGKREAAWQRWERDSPFGDRLEKLNGLFNACFRIQREASEAAGHHVPMVVENVKGAQPWVGSARWHFGSFYLWGDVPAIMPHTLTVQKFNPDGTNHGQGSWFAIVDSKNRGSAGQKVSAYSDPRRNGGRGVHLTSPRENLEGVKQRGSGPEWTEGFKGYEGGLGRGHGMDPASRHNSRSDSRKAASALIAKIPAELAQYVARYYKP
jgi:hypothetical protein